MGYSRWDADDWTTYTKKKTVGKTTRAIYSSTNIDPELNPKDINIRESRDSDVNPQSNAIIIAHDVTGSMDPVLEAMARTGLNTLVTEIHKRKPVSDPHIMCMGIGDVAAGDRAPLQATQFEADIRIAEQLTKIWLEGCGGGNSSESYHLPWYMAATRTSIDCLEKRNKKGYLFTIGDECPPNNLLPSHVESVFGTTMQDMLTTQQVLEMAQRIYHVYHVIVEEGYYYRREGVRVDKQWKDLLGQNVLNLSDHTKLSETVISAIQIREGDDIDTVVNSWDGNTSVVVRNAVSGMMPSATPDNSGIVTF